MTLEGGRQRAVAGSERGQHVMRTEAGEYVDVKVWKAAPKVLRESADRCEESPGVPFWDGVFKVVLDEAVPK